MAADFVVWGDYRCKYARSYMHTCEWLTVRMFGDPFAEKSFREIGKVEFRTCVLQEPGGFSLGRLTKQ